VTFGPADAVSFTLAQVAGLADPHPIFAAIRAASPVLRTASGLWVITGYDAANEILRDRRFRSSPIADRFRSELPPGAARDELSHRINFLDPPDHPRVRGLIQQAFTPARVRDMRPWLEQKTQELIEAIVERGADVFDMRAELAHQLPSLVISEMLGVPIADRDQLTEWTEAVTPLLGTQVEPEHLPPALAASEQFRAYAADLVAKRREKPADDLLSAMIQVGEGQERLSREELLSLVVTLYSAGHRTTRDLFAIGLYTLLKHTDIYAALARDPMLVPAAVNEFLRHDTPTVFVGRVTVEPAEVAGVSMPAGVPVLILLTAANRDPAHFPDPDRFDIARTGSTPLSFAAGPHHCLGAALARMEVEVMLTAVTRRWPDLRLSAPPPQWWSSGPFRGLTHLNVRPKG
jgi:cytochrome P450